MCPEGTEIVLITDKDNLSKARRYLHQNAPGLAASFFCVEELSPDTLLSDYSSFNRMMKSAFWESLRTLNHPN